MTTCRICTETFIPFQPLQSVCSVKCARKVPIVAKNTIRAEKKADRAKRESLKTRKDWIKDAETAFNKYIRVRDAALPCICCGEPLGKSGVGGYYDAGHFRSVGSAPHLRFDEDNVHAQRKYCNKWRAGRHADYRLGLIARRGQAVVDRLESDHRYHQWQIDELKAIVKEYRLKAKAICESRANSDDPAYAMGETT